MLKRCRRSDSFDSLPPLDAWKNAPDLVLIKLFEFLNFDGIKKARQVSKRWNEFAHKRFENEAAFVPRYTILNEKCPPWSIFRNATFTIKSIRIPWITKALMNDEFWREIGEEVHWIEILHDIHPNSRIYAEFFFHNFPKLKELNICRAQLTYLDIPETVEKINVLRVMPDSFSEEEFEGYRKVRAIKGLKELNATHLGICNLPQRIITLPHFCDDGFLKTNLLERRELGPMDVTVIKMFFRGVDFPTVNLCKNLVELYVHTQHDTSCFFTHAPMELPNLKKINITFFDKEVKICEICINHFRKCCPNVNNWLIRTSNPVYKYENLIQAIPNNAVKFYLDWGGSSDQRCLAFPPIFHFTNLVEFRCDKQIGELILNDQNFPGMPKVKKLMLPFRLIDEFEDELIEQILRKCPVVEEFHFPKLTLNQILMIEDKWPNLKSLHLTRKRDLDNEPNYFTFKELLEKLKGKFISLREWKGDQRCVGKTEEEHIQMFDKISSLRDLYDMDYRRYCQLKYGVKVEIEP